MGSLEQISQIENIRYVYGDVPITFQYTQGIAGERFLRELMENRRFLGTRCAQCGYTYLPPRLYCERCFVSLEDAWVEVGPRGTVEAITVAHLDLDDEPLAEPQTMALIRLDGADGLLVHRIGGAGAAGRGRSGVLRHCPLHERRGRLPHGSFAHDRVTGMDSGERGAKAQEGAAFIRPAPGAAIRLTEPGVAGPAPVAVDAHPPPGRGGEAALRISLIDVLLIPVCAPLADVAAHVFSAVRRGPGYPAPDRRRR